MAAGRRHLLTAVVTLVLGGSVADAEPMPPCFNFDQPIVEPLRPPLPLLDKGGNSAFGNYPSGVVWASHRTVLDLPIETVYARLLDHRNVKDMSKTKLVTTGLDRPGYLQFDVVDVEVSLRALLVRMKIAWTEHWGYCLVEGTKDRPRKIVVSYQKAAGSRHIDRQCGSYVLQAREDGTTDLSLYEEVKAARRSAKDTHNMHLGILRNITKQALALPE